MKCLNHDFNLTCFTPYPYHFHFALHSSFLFSSAATQKSPGSRVKGISVAVGRKLPLTNNEVTHSGGGDAPLSSN